MERGDSVLRQWLLTPLSGRLWKDAGRNFLYAVTLVWRYVPRLVNLWISLLGLSSFATTLWVFDPIEDPIAKVVVTVVYAVMPVLFLLDELTAKQDLRRPDPSTTWLTVLCVAVLLIVLLDRFDLPAAVISVTSALISLPALWVFWMIARGRWLLLVAIVPSMIAASLTLVPQITPSDVILGYVFVSIPIFSYACVAWALPTRWFLVRAEQSRGRPVRGPAMESLSMLFLFTPLIVLTMLAANPLGFGEIWVGLSGVMAGLIFGNTISQPFRDFVLDLGNLSTNRE